MVLTRSDDRVQIQQHSEHTKKMPESPDTPDALTPRVTMASFGVNFRTIVRERPSGRIACEPGINVSNLQWIDSMRSEKFVAEITFAAPASVTNESTSGGSEKPISFGYATIGSFEGGDIIIITEAQFDLNQGFSEPHAVFICLEDVYCASTLTVVSRESGCRFIHGDMDPADWDLIGTQLFMMFPGSKIVFRPADAEKTYMIAFTYEGKLALVTVDEDFVAKLRADPSAVEFA